MNISLSITLNVLWDNHTQTNVNREEAIVSVSSLICMYRNLSNSTRNTIVWCHTPASPDRHQAWMTCLLTQTTFIKHRSHFICIRWPDSKAGTSAVCLSLTSFICVCFYTTQDHFRKLRRDLDTQKPNITNSSLTLDRNKITVEHSRDKNSRNQINAEITASAKPWRGFSKYRFISLIKSLLTFAILMHLFL